MLFSAIAYFVGSLYFVLVSLKSCSEVRQKIFSYLEKFKIMKLSITDSRKVGKQWNSRNFWINLKYFKFKLWNESLRIELYFLNKNYFTLVPSYEIAEVWHSQTARNASNEIILKSYGKEIKLYLQPAEGFLFGEGTPVWLTYRKNGKFIHSKLNNFVKFF